VAKGYEQAVPLVTQVDFYVLEPQAQGNRFLLACRITEKAWRSGHRVYLHTLNQHECQHLDRLLWTFRELSFIPHAPIHSNPDLQRNPVLLGWDEQIGSEHDVLINLHPQVPTFFSRFERVVELIDNEAEVRTAGRQRYTFYKSRGYPLNTHKINL